MVGLIAVLPILLLQVAFILVDLISKKREARRKLIEKNSSPKVYTPQIKGGYIKDISNGDLQKSRKKRKVR